MHKLQAMIGGQTVLERTLAAVRESGLSCHLEQGPHAGMGDSIAAAVRAHVHAPGWMILPADLPLIHAQTLLAIARAPMKMGALYPLVAAKRGHPVRFGPQCAQDLMRLTGSTGAASVMAHHGCTAIELGDPGCTLDIDTVQDLERAQELLAQLQRNPVR